MCVLVFFSLFCYCTLRPLCRAMSFIFLWWISLQSIFVCVVGLCVALMTSIILCHFERLGNVFVCVCECMYIHFTNLTIIITKEKLLTAKYTEFYTLTALHNVCHAFFFHHHVFIRHWLSASASCSHLLSYTSFSRFCFGISLCLRLCTAIRSFPMQSYRKYFSIIMFCCCFFAWQTPNAKSMFWTD